MRLMSAAVAAALGLTVASTGFATTAEAAARPAGKPTKTGCVIGLEKWDAGAGRCVAAKPVKMSVAKV